MLRTIEIAPSDLPAIQRVCRDPRSWWGLPPGIADAPERPGSHRSDWNRSWRFRSQSAADRWNEEWDAVCDGKTDLPSLLGPAGFSPRNPVEGLVAWLAGRVLAEFAQEQQLYPRAREGWRFDLEIAHLHDVPSDPFHKPGLSLAIHGCLWDDADDAWFTYDAERAYPLDSLPAEIGTLLSRHRWQSTSAELA